MMVKFNTVSDACRRLALLSAMLCWAIASSTASAQSGNSLQSVTYTSLPGERVTLRLEMAQPVQDPLVFAIDNPARIAMDFPA